MGLYLCVFDDDDNELDGVEVGSYADFNFFRDAVVATVENGNAGTVCPVLNTHSDNDGEWTNEEARHLLTELSQICLLYTSPSPRDRTRSRMPSSA